MSTLQLLPPSSPLHSSAAGFWWDVPRLHQDKIHRHKGRPVTTLGPLLPHKRPRVQVTDQRSKSGPTIPTVKSFSLRTSPIGSPSGSVDMSMSRFSLDAQSLSGSLHSPSERPSSFAQGLRAKGSRLMRRQNSKLNSRSVDWPEASEDRLERAGEQDSWGVGTTKHGRIPSAGDSFIDKREISEPFNFQHLTHTHARHFRQIERASNHDLVSEFSAIRASQMPRRELKGIKTNCLPSKVSQSEPVSPTRNSPSTSPARSAYYDSAGNLNANQLNTNTPNHSESLSRSHKAHHLPGLPPARSSSRAAVTTAPDFFTAYHEEQAEEDSPSSTAGVPIATSARPGPCSIQPLVLESNNAFQDFDFSALPHAVTTPDDTAFPLTPTKLRAPGAELPDVPEEDERISVVYSPPSTPRSVLRHAMSFPSTRSNSQRWSCSPRKASARDSNPVPPSMNNIGQNEIMLPLIGEAFDDIPVRPLFSRRVSLKPQGFDTCWEDDIDYCYDHAAEADCDFDWDKTSTRVGEINDAFETGGSPGKARNGPISGEYEDVRSPSSSSIVQATIPSSLPRLQTLLPEPAALSSSNSAKSSSIASLATPATPQFPLPSPRPYGVLNQSFTGSSDALNLAPPPPGFADSNPTLAAEDLYENIFLSKRYAEEQLPLHSLRFEPPTSQDVSPRSSRSPISKCNSQESFMLSRSSSLRYPRSCDSIGSVPELVHSQNSRDRFNVSVEQLADLAATIKAAEASSDVSAPVRHRSSQNTAKEVTRTSVLQKASSFHSVEEEDSEENDVVLLPLVTHHERSQSAAVSQPPSFIAQRQRSASSSTAPTKISRGSYSLFPPPSPPVLAPLTIDITRSITQFRASEPFYSVVGVRIAPSLDRYSQTCANYHRLALMHHIGFEQQWITVQQKTFTKWLNSKVNPRDVHVNDLVTDLSDGVILIHLLEVLGNESLGRYASKPKLRVQRFENVNKALDFVKARGIQMTNIGAEDVVDGNKKIILGLIWTLILRFTISDINEEGMTAKEGLLLWCQRKTACYEEVEVRDFSGSWNDGLAFCALLDIHRPDLIDYEKLDKTDHRGNMQLAFDIASKEIGIPDLLDVEDVCDVAKPDERSLMTYIAYWFHAFSQMERVENAGRRVEKFVTNMQGAWGMQNSFEQRMKDLLREIRAQRQKWEQATFTGEYADAKDQSSQFASYKNRQKRKWVAEKSDLAALLGNIKTKMGTYRLRPYEPPDDLKLEVLDNEWAVLLKSERKRSQIINETIRDIKNNLRRSFADRANDFALTLNTLSLAISGLEGDIDDQCAHVQRLNDNLPPLDAFLSSLSLLDQQCTEANIEENDFTTYTYDELAYELGLVKSSVAKKLSFLENQMVARNMTNLTPIQLEEFESVFRHFDRDLSNSLHELEFSAALASLGLVYDEREMKETFREVAGASGHVTFEQFIRFMVSVTEDQNTAEQVFQSFREVADGKPYVTELDLRHSLIPDDLVEGLLASMPPHKGPDLQEDRHLPKFDYVGFMQNITNGTAAETGQVGVNGGIAGTGGGSTY